MISSFGTNKTFSWLGNNALPYEFGTTSGFPNLTFGAFNPAPTSAQMTQTTTSGGSTLAHQASDISKYNNLSYLGNPITNGSVIAYGNTHTESYNNQG